MRVASRAVLAVALLAGIYVLATGIALVLISLGLWAVQLTPPDSAHRSTAYSFLGLMVFAVLVLLLGLFTRTSHPHQEPGVVLTEERQPGLWLELRSLAETVGTRPPDEVRLVPDVNAAVRESSRLLGLVRGKRTMYVGAPLLVGMSRPQLRSLLAHELAHYSGRHTTLGGVVYRGQEALDNLVKRFGRRSVIGRLFALYSSGYKTSTFAIRRQQELEADDFAAKVSGPRVAAATLAELPVLEAAWEHYGEQFIGPVHDVGKRPADFFKGFANILAAPTLQAALASFRTDFDEAPTSSHDSHPPLSERIARLDVSGPAAGPVDTVPALSLLQDADGALRELQEWMYRDARYEVVPWEALLHGHDSPRTRARAEVLYRAARDVEHGEVSMAVLTESVRGRRLASYVRPLMEDPSGDDIQAASLDLLHSAVDEALMSSGARLALAWDSPPRLVDSGGRTIESRAVVEAATQAGDPALLRNWLTEHDVDPGYVPEFPEVDRRAEVALRPLWTLGVVAPVRGGGTRFLLVLTRGVLLRRARPADWFAYFTGGAKPGPTQVDRVIHRDPGELIRGERDLWLPWDEIASVSGTPRKHGVKLTFVTAGGVRHVVKTTRYSHDSGDTLSTLAYFLEDRLVE